MPALFHTIRSPSDVRDVTFERHSFLAVNHAKEQGPGMKPQLLRLSYGELHESISCSEITVLFKQHIIVMFCFRFF